MITSVTAEEASLGSSFTKFKLAAGAKSSLNRFVEDKSGWLRGSSLTRSDAGANELILLGMHG